MNKLGRVFYLKLRQCDIGRGDRHIDQWNRKGNPNRARKVKAIQERQPL